MSLEDVDLAAVGPCPACGVPVRRMGSVPIAGTNRDPITASKAWCDDCLQAKCVAEADAVRHKAAP